MKDSTRFRCVVCGKLTAGRMPIGGDGSARFPRRHKGRDGRACSGNIQEAEWVIPVKNVQVKPKLQTLREERLNIRRRTAELEAKRGIKQITFRQMNAASVKEASKV